jgi:hypothetical protein
LEDQGKRKPKFEKEKQSMRFLTFGVFSHQLQASRSSLNVFWAEI